LDREDLRIAINSIDDENERAIITEFIDDETHMLFLLSLLGLSSKERKKDSNMMFFELACFVAMKHFDCHSYQPHLCRVLERSQELLRKAQMSEKSKDKVTGWAIHLQDLTV
jgi:hypothetical protein